MIHRRTALTSLGAAMVAGVYTTVRAQSGVGGPRRERIAVLGTGHLGQALAKGWARTGHRVIYGSRTPGDDRVRKLLKAGSRVTAGTPGEAAAQADIIVFALPWKPVRDLIPALGDLSGKIIIDPMNALTFISGYPASPSDLATSVAEELQSWMPNAKVVKAFNTPSARNIIDPRRAGGHVSIPLAGGDVGAKARVAALVSDLGLEPVDTGPLLAARDLEAMMRLSFGYYMYSKGKSFEYYLVPVPG